MMLCDPPGGWQYGFPKPMPAWANESDEAFNVWLLFEGYPKKEIDSFGGKVPCRLIPVEKNSRSYTEHEVLFARNCCWDWWLQYALPNYDGYEYFTLEQKLELFEKDLRKMDSEFIAYVVNDWYEH